MVATGRRTTGRPILVVEDDPSLQSALELALQAYDLPVKVADNGREALDCVEDQRPSLVFLDMRMPVLDGWGFSEELHARGFDPPVVVMTTRDDAARIAQELGAAGFLAKPFDLRELLAIVNQHRIP